MSFGIRMTSGRNLSRSIMRRGINSDFVPPGRDKLMEVSGKSPVLKWATLRDMRGRSFNQIFADLEKYQSRFFSIQNQIKGAPYKWPLQPLYAWSRRVEYPFVIQSLASNPGLRMLDAGSGVTFFPLYLAQMLGMNVECLDKEPDNEDRLKQACHLMELVQPIPFHACDLTRRLPFKDHAFHTVLCISVLEHLPPSARLASAYDLWRLVAPGGQLILTVDVSLTGEEEGLLLSEVGEFTSKLAEVVGPLPLLPASLPRDLLTPDRPGYGFAPIGIWRGTTGPTIIRFGPRSWLFRLWGRPPTELKPLACLLCTVSKGS